MGHVLPDCALDLGGHHCRLQSRCLWPLTAAELVLFSAHLACWQVFGPYVANWINGSQDALCLRCRSLTQSTQPGHKLAREGVWPPLGP